MQVNSFEIQVIDTAINDTVLKEEFTTLGKPTLVYSGAEDKYQHIVTSSLEFNFLVKENVSAKFLSLFTASETRYKVNLVDTSVLNYPKIIWSGFLLPEQFNEPFIHSNFYVDFIATDGLGRLRSLDFAMLNADAKTSILEVINTCLLVTGQELDVYFSEAIQNNAFNLDYLDLAVYPNEFADDKGKYPSYFEVLEKCLISIGCRLFLINNAWYITGLNKFKETTISYKKYTLAAFNKLECTAVVLVNREVVSNLFLQSPSVTILPSLKSVTTIFDADYAKNLVPEDVVTHMPVNIETDIDDRTLKYWSLQTNKSFLFNVWLQLASDFDYTGIDLSTYYNGFKATPNYKVDEINSGPFVFFNTAASSCSLADLDDNFGYLTNPFFVYGSEDLERYATLKIKFDAYLPDGVTDQDISDYFKIKGAITTTANNGSGNVRATCTAHGLYSTDVIKITDSTDYDGIYEVTVIDANTFDINKVFTTNQTANFVLLPFKNQFKWAITRKDHLTDAIADEEIYISNFEDANTPSGMFDFDVKQDNFLVTGTLDIEKIALTEDGFYNVRLYPSVVHPLLRGLLVYKEYSLTLNIEKEVSLTQTRNINFTQTKEVDVFYSSDRMSNTNRSFLFSDAFTTAISNGTVVPSQIELVPISYTSTPVYNAGILWYTIVEVVVNDEDYNRLLNGYSLFVVRQGTSTLVEVPSTDYALENNNDKKVILQYILTTGTAVQILETDTIYTKIDNANANLNYANFWLDKFKRYDVEESVHFYKAINAMYHDLLATYNFKVVGEIPTLVGPLDIVAFQYNTLLTTYPTNLVLNLSEGKTQLTVIETKNSNVTDYAE